MDKETNIDLPVAYASRTLNKAERNYSVFERELLAIKWVLDHFRCYCYGTPLVVFTDHKPLVSLDVSKIQGSDRMARWRERLMAYDITILYKPGKDNLGADALSRLIKKQKIESDIFYLHHGPKPRIHSARNALKNENYYNLLIGEDSDTDESELDSETNNKLIINKKHKKRAGTKSSKETTRTEQSETESSTESLNGLETDLASLTSDYENLYHGSNKERKKIFKKCNSIRPKRANLIKLQNANIRNIGKICDIINLDENDEKNLKILEDLKKLVYEVEKTDDKIRHAQIVGNKNNSKTGTVPKNYCLKNKECNPQENIQNLKILAITRAMGKNNNENITSDSSENEPEQNKDLNNEIETESISKKNAEKHKFFKENKDIEVEYIIVMHSSRHRYLPHNIYNLNSIMYIKTVRAAFATVAKRK
jgi:hypothetical protein